MPNETQAAELPRQDDAFQAAVDEQVDAVISVIASTPNTGLIVQGSDEQLRLELERSLWDFAATWTALLEERASSKLWHPIKDAPENLEVLLCEPHMPDRALDCYYLARRNPETGWEETYEGLRFDPDPDSVFMYLRTSS